MNALVYSLLIYGLISCDSTCVFGSDYSKTNTSGNPGHNYSHNNDTWAARVQTKDTVRLQKLRTLISDTIAAHDNLALAHIHKGDKKTAAGVHYGLGEIFYRIGWTSFATAQFTKGLAIDPEPSAKAYNTLGRLYGEAGDYDNADQALRKALHLEPNCAPINIDLGLVYLKQKLEEQAKAEFDKALQIEPNSPEVYQNLAVYYYENQDYEKALEEWKNLSQIDPNYPNLRRNINLVEQLMKKGSLTVGKRQELSDSNKSQVSIPEVVTEGKHDLAIVGPTKALDIYVGDAETYYRRGLEYHNKGQFKRAISNYSLAIRRSPNDLTPNYVPTLIRELSMFFILQSDRRSVAQPGGLQLAAKAAGVI